METNGLLSVRKAGAEIKKAGKEVLGFSDEKTGPYPTEAIPAKVVKPHIFYPGVIMVSPNN